MGADNTKGKGVTTGCSPYVIRSPTWTSFLTLKMGSFEAQWASLGWGKTGNVTEMNVLQILSPTDWHLPSAFTRIKSCAAVAANLQHPLERGSGGDQEGGALCSGKNCQDRSSDG